MAVGHDQSVSLAGAEPDAKLGQSHQERGGKSGRGSRAARGVINRV